VFTRFLPRSRRSIAEVTVRPGEGPFRPGDQVDVEVSILPQESFTVGEALLSLVCRETFWYTVESTGATWVGRYPGHAEENHRGTPYTAAGRPGRYKTSKELVRLSSPFLVNVRLFKAIPYRSRVRFRLPEGAPPSIIGDTARVDWQFYASWAVPEGLDTRRVGRLDVVLPPAEGKASQDQSLSPDHLADTAYQQCILSLSLPALRLRTGQDFEGTLTARVRSRLKVSTVRAALECREQSGAKESTTTHSMVVLQRQALLRAGSVYEWPFRLTAPDRLLPSITMDETSVTWRVKGVLHRSLRTDLEVQHRIEVHCGERWLGERKGHPDGSGRP
jgi:hypothetical protein